MITASMRFCDNLNDCELLKKKAMELDSELLSFFPN